MTTLVLVQRKISFFHSRLHEFVFVSRFFRILGAGRTRIVLLLLLVAGIGVYLGSLYFTSQQGFALRNSGITEVRIFEEIASLQLKIQSEQSAILSQEVLKSMEKISSIRYLTSRQVAVTSAR